MTNMTEPVDVVLKTDELGRVRMPAERRERLLEEFERSGLSGRKFAALVGVNYQTFAGWVQRKRHKKGGSKASLKAVEQVRWLEAVVTEAQSSGRQSSSPLKVHLPGGAWLEISQSQQVELASALVRALNPPVPGC